MEKLFRFLTNVLLSFTNIHRHFVENTKTFT